MFIRAFDHTAGPEPVSDNFFSLDQGGLILSSADPRVVSGCILSDYESARVISGLSRGKKNIPGHLQPWSWHPR